MALGDENKGNGKKLYENTYYSRVSFKNKKKDLTINFKNGMMLLNIDKIKEDFTHETIISVYITSTKAKLMLAEIEKFKAYIAEGDIDVNRGFGIATGMGETITVAFLHADSNKSTILTIAKIDPDGNYTKREDFEFATGNDCMFSIGFKDFSSPSTLTKNYAVSLDLDMLTDALSQFALNGNGALAYTVADLTRYDLNRIMKKMDPIYDKLGIERQSNQRSGQRNNFMTNAPSGTAEHRSLDDLADGIGDDED